MRVAIVGSRAFASLDLVVDYVNTLPLDSVVVTGGARGVDSVAEYAAKQRGIKTEVYVPAWNVYGKSAGFRRNAEIVAACDRVVAFWDGVSRGTQHTIHLARTAGKPVKIIRADDDAGSEGVQ